MRAASWVVCAAAVAVVLSLAPMASSVAAEPPDIPMPTMDSEWGNDSVPLAPGERPLRRTPVLGPRLATGQVYDVHVYVLATPTRPAPFTEEEARTYLERVNTWYAGELGARAPSFRFAGRTVVAAPREDYCGLRESEAVIGAQTLNALRPSQGAVDATWFIVTPDVPDGVECDVAGQATLSGRGVWVKYADRSIQNDKFFKTTVHEFGHNLGLTHAGVVHTRSGVAGWQGDGGDTFDAYADQADPMGRTPIVWDATRRIWTYPTSHLQGHNRNVLGAMPATAIAAAPRGATTRVSLAPLTAEAGTRLLYIPLLNRSKFYLEYRTATGLDSTFPIDTTHLSPGPGVYLRMVNTGTDAGPAGFDPSDGTQVGTLAWPAETWESDSTANSVRIGMRAGQTATLPDGSTVTIGQLTAASADVTVVRPADVEDPTISADLQVQGCPTPLGEGATCTLVPNGSAGSMRLSLTLPKATDNEWLSSVVISLDGREIVRRVSPAPGILGIRSGLAEGQPRGIVQVDVPLGSHTITSTATDLSGRVVTRSASLNLTDNRLAAAPTGLTWTWRSPTSVTLTWRAPAFTAGRAIDRYWIERSDDGGQRWNRISSTGGTSAVVENLPVGVPLRFRVAAETAAGVGAWALTNEVVLHGLLPGPPRSVVATPGDRQVTVQWQPPESDGGMPITRYTVTSSEGETCTTATTQCTVEGLVNGVPYTFTVVATNALGDSNPTDPTAQVTPMGGLPGVVTDLRGSATGRKLWIAWTPPADDGGSPITGYRYRIGAGAWRTTTQTAATVRIRRTTRQVTLTVQAGNASGFGPEVSASLQVR